MFRIPDRCQRGFSLIEMSIALIILGMLVAAAVTVVTRLSQSDDRLYSNAQSPSGELGGFDPYRMDAAIIGFMRANHRLPCPDINGNGLEDCLDDGGVPVSVGHLPLATLQLTLPPAQSWRLPVAYGIYRGQTLSSDLGRALPTRFIDIPSQHDPYCPPGTLDADCVIDHQINRIASNIVLVAADNNTLNVLDSCDALSRAHEETASSLSTTLLHAGVSDVSAQRTNVAYALSWTSRPALLAGGDLLESRQPPANPLRFFPSGYSPEGSDDLTLIKSFLETAEALFCAERSGDVELTLHASASVMTSEYLNRVRLAHLQLFAEDAEDSLEAAERAIVFGAVSVALATASLALAIAEATQGNPVAIVSAVVSAAELANTIAGLVLAVEARDAAEDFLDFVLTGPLTLARGILNHAGDLMLETRAVAETVQQRGQL
jgi:prepilin-type N-terminal cleavage/methylation domain-containing protein